MNRIILIGNLTADPDAKKTSSGMIVCHFNVADNYTADGETKTNYFRVTAFRKTAENCATYLSKGRKVAVVGRIVQNDYLNANGEKVRGEDIIADEVQFLTPQTEEKQKSKTVLEPVEDDLPF